MDAQVQRDLRTLKEVYEGSPWLKNNELEPLVGDEGSPHLTQTYGLPRRSCLTVFVWARDEGEFGCRFERCHAFTSRSIEDAIKHLRKHHFDHRPFVCLPTDGKTW
jgi:hypothetical protein